jgi:hypothetical protein
MSLADREKILVPLKAKADRERAEAELMYLETDYQFENKRKENPTNPAFSGRTARTSAGDVAKRTLEKMSPEEKKAELARLKEWGKAQEEESKKQWAVEVKKMKEERAKAAVDDGLGEESAPTTNPTSAPTAVANAAAGTAAAAPAAAPAAQADPDADPDEDGGSSGSASGGTATATPGNGSSGSGTSRHSGTAAAVVTGLFALVLFYVLIGGLFPAIFLLMALLFAYRTAAGATWG